MNKDIEEGVQIKRVYEPADCKDGVRVFVDRIWPRGFTKELLKADVWMKDVAPSTTLRKWFNHEQAKWEEFKHRYIEELESNEKEVKQLLDLAAKEKITLLFAARDTLYNHAVVLKEYLVSKLKR